MKLTEVIRGLPYLTFDEIRMLNRHVKKAEAKAVEEHLKDMKSLQPGDLVWVLSKEDTRRTRAKVLRNRDWYWNNTVDVEIMEGKCKGGLLRPYYHQVRRRRPDE